MDEESEGEEEVVRPPMEQNRQEKPPQPPLPTEPQPPPLPPMPDQVIIRKDYNPKG